MDNVFAKILEAGVLPEELMTQLQEAFDKKVADNREEAELAIREEFSRRYEHDKGHLIEAMEAMIGDTLKEHEETKKSEIDRFVAAHVEARKAVKEAKTRYEKKLAEHTSKAEKLIVEGLTKHISGLREEKRRVVHEGARYKSEFQKAKATLAEANKARLARVDSFVAEQVTRELKEFNHDKKALVETRAKLISESRQKVAELQKNFVKEAAKKVEKSVTETLKVEMRQLHEDLERNRQNMFGRRIFEAVAAEFMNSHLAEGTEVRKLQNELATVKEEVSSVQVKLDEARQEADAVRRKAKLAEDRASRAKVMSELLANLRGDKRNVMENMLESVKTDNLRGAFDRYLPVVLSEGNRPTQKPVKQTISEGKKTDTVSRPVTGNRAASPILESSKTSAEVEVEEEVANVIRLAGLNR